MAGSVPTILVAAGTNGGGKSSIVQPFIENRGGAYFDPDRYTQSLVRRGMPLAEANAHAWSKGFNRLCEAIERNQSYAFETTLGGHSIAHQLMRALAFGRRVTFLYVGLASVDLHIQRVRSRVARGGHDIPDEKIRQRYDESRKNLVSFIGTTATIRVWDNSAENVDGIPAGAEEVFRIEARRVLLPPAAALGAIPAWARPLLGQALKLDLPIGGRSDRT